MSTGVLTWDEMLKVINLNTGFFETSQYDIDSQMRIIAGNHDGAGMSAGNLQYNWGAADRLSELFNYMLNNFDSVVKTAFTGYTSEYNTFKTVNLTYTRVDKIAWGDSITDPNNAHTIIEPWLTCIGNILATDECQAKYFEMQDAYYTGNALELFKQLNCTSRASLASIFDVIINRGRFYPCNTLVADFDLIDANESLSDVEKELQKVYQINTRANDRTNATYGTTQTLLATRRTCMANLGGDYFGATYEPDSQFDVNTEPALLEKSKGDLLINLGETSVSSAYLGSTAISRVYLGSTLLGSDELIPYETQSVPDSQFRTEPNSYLGFEDGSVTLDYEQMLWIDIQNFVACRTYYTTDGTDPTQDSAQYHDGLSFTESCTLKVLNVSLSGVAEPIRTLEITVKAEVVGYRYIKFIGHGDQTGGTTRLCELQALEGATNRLLGLSPISGETPSAGGAVTLATDGTISYTSGQFPLWWVGAGTPTLVYDLGDVYPIDSILVAMYSPSTDPRQAKFMLYASKDNSEWTLITDQSANTTTQPTAGFTYPITY